MKFVYQSQYMHGLLDQARRFAASSATVLLQGESGTGKEMLARYLHDQSRSSSQPFLPVTCAALDASRADSELFGHDSGAFPGADRQREGLIESAQAGTLFLDEVSELPLPIQARLLRILEQQEYSRAGSSVVRRVRCRIVATTSRDLQLEVAEGRFREDLYHRLDVLPMNIAPLREHPQDIPVLATHFVTKLSSDNQCTATGISAPAMKQLKGFHWPGNVRQLKNAILRACLLSDEDHIPSFDLPVDRSRSLSVRIPPALEELPLKEIERHVILARLDRFGGNKTEAAAALGVTARTLHNKMVGYAELKKAS